MKKLLLVFAHPDDESFGCGGTIAKYVKAGWTVRLLCATRGEAGKGIEHHSIDDELFGQMRSEELRFAAKILGISKVSHLDYRDGRLSEQNPGELEDKVFQHMAEFAPDAVITFGPDGVSNHPDHIRMSFAATFAFQKYAIAVQDPEAFTATVSKLTKKKTSDGVGQSEMPEVQIPKDPKLYYAVMPQSVVEYLQRQKVLPVESFGKPWKGTPDKLITTVIDCSRVRHKKIQALEQHITQGTDVGRYLGFSGNPLLSQEFFLLRYIGVREAFMGKNDRVADRL